MSGITASGTITFSSIRILSSGTFTIIASSSGITSATSSSISISNYVTSVSAVTSNASPSINFSVTITVTLTGEDTNLFTGSATVTLADSASGMSGTLSASNNGGTATFTVYFTTSGSRIITASTAGSSSTITGTVSITVSVQSLRVYSYSPLVIFIQPSTTLNTFTLVIGVYDYAGTTLETIRGPYIVAIALSSGTLSSTASQATSSGLATFANLRILSAGTFTITASSTGITSITTSSVIISNYAYSIALVTSTSTPSKNFSFTITATLTGEDGAAFTGSCTVALAENGGNTIYGSPSATSTTGTVGLSIYFIVTGSMAITATCPAYNAYPAVTSTISVNVQTIILQITSFTPVCFI